jgi:hypothetical protein
MGPMAISIADRLAVHELVALHGHRRESDGWRIAYRKVTPRRTPLSAFPD